MQTILARQITQYTEGTEYMGRGLKDCSCTIYIYTHMVNWTLYWRNWSALMWMVLASCALRATIYHNNCNKRFTRESDNRQWISSNSQFSAKGNQDISTTHVKPGLGCLGKTLHTASLWQDSKLQELYSLHFVIPGFGQLGRTPY